MTSHPQSLSPSDQPVIEFRGVTKRFGAIAAVVDNNLAVTQAEFLSILGPSGCGKTTSLRMMAGFEPPPSSMPSSTCRSR